MPTIFQKLSDKYNINTGWLVDTPILGEDDTPCFTRRAQCPEEMEVKDMVPYLKACARETIGVVLLSTTSRERMHKQWLEAAKTVGANITKGRSTGHGGYPVWLITLTGKKKV